ncbi:LrgB family protein [Bacillus timonensis]|nr:LrgB family protein [Bacillus timonensis]
MILMPIFIICVTIFIFQFMKRIYNMFPTPLLVPITTSTVIIVTILMIGDIPYDTYMIGGKWIDGLLGPAVVALAYPLYQNFASVKAYFVPIFFGGIIGSSIAILSGIVLGIIFQLDKEIIVSLTPKSVTSPVAMEIAGVIGGIPSLAVVFVMIAGVFGAMFGPSILKMLKINHHIGMGMGLGAASHGIGTTRALEIGKREAAISSISMIISAVFSSILCPILIWLVF